MIRRNSNNKIDGVFVLMIFCIFAVSVFLVLMLSGSTYANMTDISAEGQNERIALSYIRTKIRKSDTANAVYISDFNGMPSINLSENIGEREFVTRIYFYDGWLRELFHETGFDFELIDGVPLIKVNNISFEEVENGLIRITTDYASTLILPRSS